MKILLNVIDEECFEYEEKNSFTREENIGILNDLEDKYINNNKKRRNNYDN